MSDLQEFTADEVAKHDTLDDLWVIYNGEVYDITKYIDEHPGGEEVVVDCAGTDATEAFDDIGHSDEAKEILASLKVGKLKGGVIKAQPVKGASTSEGGLPAPLLAIAVLALAGAFYYFLV
ncbi:cytochrome b5 [Diutina catenulata]